MVVVRPHHFATIGAGCQAVQAKPLAAILTEIHAGAKLLAATAAHRTRPTNEPMRSFFGRHRIGPQMGNTLTLTTLSTLALAAIADGIKAGWTLASMVLAGALSTGPTKLATAFAICLFTDRTSRYTANLAVDRETRCTLL